MDEGAQGSDLQEMIERGRAALKDARTDEAMRIFAAVLARDPGNYTARTGMGAALMNLGRAKEAIEHFRRAVASRPRSPSALTNLGRAYHAAGELPVAADLFREALSIDPSYEKARQAQDALAKDQTWALAGGRPTTPAGAPSTEERRLAAEAVLAGGAHAATLRAKESRSLRTPLIVGSVVFGAIIVYLFVLYAAPGMFGGRSVTHYRGKKGEFEIDVPKGWVAKEGSAYQAALEKEGTTVAFSPTGMTAPIVRFRIIVVPIGGDVTMDTLSEFAGYLDRREDADYHISRGQFGPGPRYPIDSQAQVTLGGVPAMEFVLKDDTVGNRGPRWVYHTLAIYSGKVYSVRFEALDKDYKKLIDRIRKSVATFKITTPTTDETSG
jgi:hypothetical protein